MTRRRGRVICMSDSAEGRAVEKAYNDPPPILVVTQVEGQFSVYELRDHGLVELGECASMGAAAAFIRNEWGERVGARRPLRIEAD